MADRAWGRIRLTERRGRRLRTVPMDSRLAEAVAAVPGPEDEISTSVSVRALDRRLHDPWVPRPVVRAWETVVELAEQDERTLADRNRWQYARRVLRRHVTADLELVDMV